MGWKQGLADTFLPPRAQRILRPQRYGHFGDYPSWDEAAKHTRPYETDFAAADRGIAAVQAGAEPGATFSVILAAMLLVERMRVLDFGGGLGSIYFRAARAVPNRIVSWRVVDLPAVVAHGSRHHRTDALTFHEDISDAGDAFDLIVCGGTLQYLREPYEMLSRICALEAPSIVLDRLPLHSRERFMVQRVPPHLGGTILTWRVLDEVRLNAAMAGYEVFLEHRLEHPGPEARDERYVARIYRRISSH